MELVAHRAGNDPLSIAPALQVTDTIELDLHLFRNRIEIRHEKVLWPFAVYWERWHLARDLRPRELADILAVAPDEAHVWLDLKGFTPRLAKRALRTAGNRRPLTVSTRNWWTLGPPRRADGVRTLRSVGSRWQLWIVTRRGVGRTGDGIVMHERFADASTVDVLRSHTDDLVVWAVDSLDRALELYELGVTGMIVDDLGVIDSIRRRLADIGACELFVTISGGIVWWDRVVGSGGAIGWCDRVVRSGGAIVWCDGWNG